jgi:hypothetical protein
MLCKDALVLTGSIVRRPQTGSDAIKKFYTPCSTSQTAIAHLRNILDSSIRFIELQPMRVYLIFKCFLLQDILLYENESVLIHMSIDRPASCQHFNSCNCK